jgi:hypothetical protein
MKNTLEVDQEELDRLNMICKTISTTDKVTEMVIDAYRAIKMMGSARRIDVAHFLSAGIPMYMALAEVKKVTSPDVAKALSAGSIPFSEVKQAIQYLTAEPGLFYIPKKR